MVNTVTTLGATFSTTGAKLAITPGCVGEVPCAAAENRPVETHSIVPINNPKDRRIALGVKRFTHQVNRTLH